MVYIPIVRSRQNKQSQESRRKLLLNRGSVMNLNELKGKNIAIDIQDISRYGDLQYWIGRHLEKIEDKQVLSFCIQPHEVNYKCVSEYKSIIVYKK